MKNTKAKIALLAVAILASIIFSPVLLLAQGKILRFGQVAQSGSGQTEPSDQASDQTPPSDVENVEAAAGDSEVTLSWDIATDNVAVTEYKIYYGTQSVNVDGAVYEFPPILVDDVVTHTVTGLRNDATYYFAITAIDAAGNESVNYSAEVSATPEEGLRPAALEDDGKPPEIVSAEASAEDLVKVEFSEPVILPIEDPEKAFEIKKVSDESALQVKEAELDPEDELGKTVMLLTEMQEAGAEYEITVSIGVEDHFGNAVISGEDAEEGEEKNKTKFLGFETSDSGTETEGAETEGTETEGAETEEEPEAPADTVPPTVSNVNAPIKTQLQVTFSEAVTMGRDPKAHFIITKKDSGERLNIINVSLSTDRTVAFINTAEQKRGQYEVRVSGVTDAAGNEIDASVSLFDGKGDAEEEAMPPEEGDTDLPDTGPTLPLMAAVSLFAGYIARKKRKEK